MIVNEIFYSLQGEGRLVGTPSAFVRLAGCPLRCKWCDTKYAWADDAGDEMTVEDVVEKVLACKAGYVVITGGEPMGDPELAALTRSLSGEGMHITIETSGIEFVEGLECNLMSISPKMSNSTPDDAEGACAHDKRRGNLEVLQQLVDEYPYQLKFVIDSSADLDEVAECLDQLKNPNPYKVFLMPQASERSEYITKSRILAEICKQTGFAFSPRLHLLLWDNERGK